MVSDLSLNPLWQSKTRWLFLNVFLKGRHLLYLTHPGCLNVSLCSKYLLHQWKCFHHCNKTNICFGMGGMAYTISYVSRHSLIWEIAPLWDTNQGGDFCSLKKTLSQDFSAPCCSFLCWMPQMFLRGFLLHLQPYICDQKVYYLAFNLLPKVLNHQAVIWVFSVFALIWDEHIKTRSA